MYLCTVFHGFSIRQITGFKEEVRRVLKPGGRLAVVEIVKTDTPFGPPLRMRYSPEELKSTLGFLPLATVSVGEYLICSSSKTGEQEQRDLCELRQSLMVSDRRACDASEIRNAIGNWCEVSSDAAI